MKIIVPSLGRAGTANSMKWLLQANRDIVFAVHKDEEEAYHRAYGGAYFDVPEGPRRNIGTLILSDKSRHHTGLVRKEIMHHYREPFFFVDDDIRISLKALANIEEVFNLLENHIKCGASLAGLAPQLFSTFANTTAIDGDLFAIRNKFVATVYAIDPVVFDNCPLEQLAVYEDIALVIHAIQYGGGTVVTYVATHNNVSPPGGGCNSWRTKEITLDCLNKLVELYPDICSIRETKNTTHSQNIGVGLRVAWNKIRKL